MYFLILFFRPWTMTSQSSILTWWSPMFPSWFSHYFIFQALNYDLTKQYLGLMVTYVSIIIQSLFFFFFFQVLNYDLMKQYLDLMVTYVSIMFQSLFYFSGLELWLDKAVSWPDGYLCFHHDFGVKSRWQEISNIPVQRGSWIPSGCSVNMCILFKIMINIQGIPLIFK